MSLRFYFGPSGAGKSYKLYRELLERAHKEPGTNFLVIVPDQFTMQTQKDLCLASERGGIMNIDVLSFGRLSHRIFEEVGGGDTPTLDDTGKSLVLQRVAGTIKDKLPVLGGHLHKQGYIHEVKSAISEFMQYGISVADMQGLISFAEKRGALSLKLKDLELLYRSFMEYIQGHFITTEERLDLLRAALHKSEILPGSVVVFDGFTGFTPIQNRLIGEIMSLAQETIVTLTLGEGASPYEVSGEHCLFHLSQKTVKDLTRIATERRVERGRDEFVPGGARFALSKPLAHLEKSLFATGFKPYGEVQEDICLLEAASPREEVHQVGLVLEELVRSKDLQYRDIALICGNLDGYAPYIESEFSDMGIPCYIDKTRLLSLNPMIEYIKSALELFIRDFSYEVVFHYLRSGLADFTPDEVDELENYVISTGIRGRKSWHQEFTHKTAAMGQEEEALQAMNALRRRVVEGVEALGGKNKQTAEQHVLQLYSFLTESKVEQKLFTMAEQFTGQGNLTRAKEYEQIYRLVMELLQQIHGLLGEEEITRQEFLDILEAGFGEIEVGTIPQNVDRCLVGDMERTRLKQVKYLFFLGVNDGNIPKNASKGGIISDMDREFLRESDLELAPSPRQQMFIQRFYLYLNLTKPSEKLYLSYAKVGSDGKGLRPAYLIDIMKRIFPQIPVVSLTDRTLMERIVTPKEGIPYLAEGLREYVALGAEKFSREELFTLYQAYGENEDYRELAETLKNAAFLRYQASGLSKAVSRALYGLHLENSVTRLEAYAACAYRHFLQYGLSLQEREEFGFEAVDMGNVFHGVLDDFSKQLDASDYTWFDFPEQFGVEAVNKAMDNMAAQYGSSVLYSSARNEYAIGRMKRILSRSVCVLQNQLKKGEFVPEGHEVSFKYAQNLDSVSIALSEQERMHLMGRIDRIDVAEDAENVYVKVVDYKSGDKHFDLAAVYHGLQLQLVVYMNAALELEAKRHPGKNIVPAAILYYHVADPMVEVDGQESPEELNQRILMELRTKGVVNSREDIIDRLDRFVGNKSDSIPVEKKKDGTLGARSSVMSSEELEIVSGYVSHKVRSIGKEILEGHKECSPYEQGDRSACTFCSYKKVCGFEPGIPGYEKRSLEKHGDAEVLKRMKEET
ncbi:MAG: helicase-exonuclease AddAB subunit AddB [Lachnospiraceae bacterium]|nr:helicase-exonuclease AddAB subunit AddB [Lachnospiraceae bacterium]